MHLSTNYYRNPFPSAEHWRADIRRIAETGFDNMYLPAAWPQIEAEPGKYDFSDLDEIVDIAAENGITVILNLAAEVQPTWIHRLYPGAEMVDHMGRTVRSSTLAYINYGIMPGGCSDHPDIREAIGRFYRAIARRYADRPNLLAWDCWNEMRWASQADGHVCFCKHTVARFHGWLRTRYGTLEAFNKATFRRYVSWDDVLPAKSQARNNTDMILWQQFITDRTAEDLRWRYELLRAEDPRHPIQAHAAFPTPFCTGEFYDWEPALARGNDWQLARQVDAYGCSHFPAWFHPSPPEFGARLESIRSAAGDKPCWIAELQGGAAGHGPQAMPAIPADRQARWVWNGVARGAKGVNFWTWKDEVFGRESGGFGIVGDDGHAEARVAALRRTADLIREHEALLDAYRPAPAKVAVVFEPDNYHLDWSSWTRSDLAPPKDKPYPAGHSLLGYLLAFERLQLPYDVIEAPSAPDLDGYSLIVLPWPLVVDGPFSERLAAWVEAGGTLLTEASLAAFDSLGFFTYPADRALPRRLGFTPSGRRQVLDPDLPFEIAGRAGTLQRSRWREELAPAAGGPAGGVLDRALGSGRVVAPDSFVGTAYWDRRYPDFEVFLGAVAERAGATPGVNTSISDGERLQWRFGLSGETPLLFLINEGPGAELEVALDLALLGARRSALDLTSGARREVVAGEREARLTVTLAEGAYHVLRFD